MKRFINVDFRLGPTTPVDATVRSSNGEYTESFHEASPQFGPSRLSRCPCMPVDTITILEAGKYNTSEKNQQCNDCWADHNLSRRTDSVPVTQAIDVGTVPLINERSHGQSRRENQNQ